MKKRGEKMKIYSIKITLPFSKLAPQTAQKTITDPIYPNRKIFLFIESPELKKTMSLLPRTH